MPRTSPSVFAVLLCASCCTAVSAETEGQFIQQWVKGNLPLVQYLVGNVVTTMRGQFVIGPLYVTGDCTVSLPHASLYPTRQMNWLSGYEVHLYGFDSRGGVVGQVARA